VSNTQTLIFIAVVVVAVAAAAAVGLIVDKTAPRFAYDRASVPDPSVVTPPCLCTNAHHQVGELHRGIRGELHWRLQTTFWRVITSLGAQFIIRNGRTVASAGSTCADWDLRAKNIANFEFWPATRRVCNR
jgi:hypothetical protein